MDTRSKRLADEAILPRMVAAFILIWLGQVFLLGPNLQHARPLPEGHDNQVAVAALGLLLLVILFSWVFAAYRALPSRYFMWGAFCSLFFVQPFLAMNPIRGRVAYFDISTETMAILCVVFPLALGGICQVVAMLRMALTTSSMMSKSSNHTPSAGEIPIRQG